MPTDKPESHKDNGPYKSVSDSQIPISKGETPHSSQETIRGDNNAQNKARHHKIQTVNINKIPKIDVIEGKEANDIARSANKISKFSTIANFCLLFCTFILAGYAVKQANSAQSAAEIANKTLIADTIYNNKTLANQNITNRTTDSLDKIKNRHDDSVFQYQKRSLGAQITAIQETQKEFKSQNEPYLQINFDTVSLEMYKQRLSYSISNATKTPIKVLKSRYSICIFKDDINYGVKKAIFTNRNFYITNDVPYNGFLGGTLVLAQEVLDAVKIYKTSYIWVYGEIVYKNLVDGNNRRYNYTVKITYTHPVNPYQDFIKSDNIDIK